MEGPPRGEEVGVEMQAVRRELTRRSVCGPSAPDGCGSIRPGDSMRATQWFDGRVRTIGELAVGGDRLPPGANVKCKSTEGFQMHNKSEQATAWGVILFALAPLGC